MAKPILRVGKIKRTGRVSLASVDNHLSRSRPTPNADPKRTGQNVWLAGGPGQLAAAVDRKLTRCGISRERLRRDATLANDVLLTVSPEWFRPEHPDRHGHYDPARLAVFRREAVEFLREQFPGRVVAAVLHLDEATPHIQAVVVPVLRRDDGTFRLSGKDTFNPERLRALQGAWEARLRPHGVDARVQNSRARHTTLKTYYSALGAAPKAPEPLPPTPPPMRALLPTSSGREALAAWQEGETRKAKRRMRPLEAAAAKVALYEAERLANIELRRVVTIETERAEALSVTAEKLSNEVTVTREQAARLRGIPINQVAHALGYTGEIGKRENAIDLVKRVGSLDYAGATAWLHHAFGADAAAAETRKHFMASPPPPALTKAEQTKARAIERQLDALAAPAYRITIMRNVDGRQIGQNLGKSAEGEPEKTFTKQDILGMLPTLTSHNSRGGNVFITPLDPAARHVLIDDLSVDQVAALKARGYAPATIIETSPGNCQALIKVSCGTDQRAANEWFKQLNRELGDEKITGLVHPFRLAGFQNRKEKHRQENGHYPFVRVVEAVNRFCAHARQVVERLAQHLDQVADQVATPSRTRPRM